MSNKVFTSFKVVGILWSFDDSGFAYFSYMRFFLNLCSMSVCILLLLVLLQFGQIRRRPMFVGCSSYAHFLNWVSQAEPGVILSAQLEHSASIFYPCQMSLQSNVQQIVSPVPQGTGAQC